MSELNYKKKFWEEQLAYFPFTLILLLILEVEINL
jgi:hypothetical protein